MIAVLIPTAPVFAENINMISAGAGRNSIIGMGLFTFNWTIGTIASIPDEGEEDHMDKKAGLTTWHLAYDRLFFDCILFGLVYNYEKAHYRLTYYDGDYTEDNLDVHTVMPRARLYWGFTHWKFYHGFGVGKAFYYEKETEYTLNEKTNTSDSSTSLAVHVYVLGIEYKINDRFSVYTDLGLGWQGMINYGVAFSF